MIAIIPFTPGLYGVVAYVPIKTEEAVWPRGEKG